MLAVRSKLFQLDEISCRKLPLTIYLTVHGANLPVRPYCLSGYLSLFVYESPCIYLLIHLVYLHICLFPYLAIYRPIYIHIVHLSICLRIDICDKISTILFSRSIDLQYVLHHSIVVAVGALLNKGSDSAVFYHFEESSQSKTSATLFGLLS